MSPLKTEVASSLIYNEISHPLHGPTASMRSSPACPLLHPKGLLAIAQMCSLRPPGPLYLLPRLPVPRCSHITLQSSTAVMTQLSPPQASAVSPTSPFHPAVFLKGTSKLELGLWITTLSPLLSHTAPEPLDGARVGGTCCQSKIHSRFLQLD